MKFIASVLIALVIAPLTAPFRTCDLVALFGEPAHAQSLRAPALAFSLAGGARARSRRLQSEPVHNEASAEAAPAPSIAAQPRNTPGDPARSVAVLLDSAVAVVSVRSSHGRSRYSPLLRAPSAVTLVSAFSIASSRAARPLPSLAAPASTSTVLRV
jgi:hypothetical protein